MTSLEIRRAFLEFFAARGHRIVPSSPLVLPKDPTLLFANAGMNQFKDVFTGKEKREYVRATSSQKCLRVSGKHNDLEQVGRTPRHHTFFEMLGNFSFGDYFKKEAISFAWDLITKVYGVPADRLWVTVFAGTEQVPGDDEALAIWRDVVGVDPSRILRLGEKDNFWRMGDTGPCGPCSEIHYDLGADLTSVAGVSNPDTDTRRYIEIWNLVFMQFEQHADGRLEPLPAPSIDTGMGLERITSVLQGKRSNYDTDLFQPILHAAARASGRTYGEDDAADVSMRVIADHIRAHCFLVADGVVPANDKRGYVLRRVLRRAIRHGRKLGIQGPFLHGVAPAVIETLGEVYPEIVGAMPAILEVARREEERFGETVAAGLTLLDEALAKMKGEARVLPGADLFRLYDTFGLPLDLAQDVAEERGITLDMPGFEAELGKQRQRAQASWKGGKKEEAAGAWHELAGRYRTVFEGFRVPALEGVKVAALIDEAGSTVNELREGATGEVLLEATPFYGEAGGQIGDTGWIVSERARVRVDGTHRPAAGLIASRVLVESGRLAVGEYVAAEIDVARRDAIRRNHTATHLLHAALREVVGTHVKQAGSLVAPDRLRFDFSHFAGVGDRALADIESLVNRKVLENAEITTDVLPLDEALQSGAMALFGEKYGENVRVVTIGSFSKELCGGTHCARTGEIGMFLLTHERGVASGTRRVEAVTGEGSLEKSRSDHQILRRVEDLLSVPRHDAAAELGQRLEQLRVVQRDLEQQRVRAVREDLARRAASPEVAAGVKVLAARVDGLSAQESRVLADDLRKTLGSGIVVLGRADDGKASLLVAVTDDVKGKVGAGELVRELAAIIGGGGGGRQDLAEAGGKDPSRLDEALRTACTAVARRIEASASPSS
ncbi:MAG TPA: alanine--tRNA ligase [Candidatus Polarisedimenticolaceae bacterium]|nr:alanine--tRNA ligase [Candidatus Polarisedimenticolaceae bacterium]